MRAVRSRAFSLIELLVVLGMIMVLLGLLAPTLAKTKIQAQRTMQLVQVGQIAGMITLYTKDYRGIYPIAGGTQFLCMERWFEPVVEGGYADSLDEIDPASMRRDGTIAYAMSGSMVSARDFYVPSRTEYPPQGEREIATVLAANVVFPSSKGLAWRYKIGYDQEFPLFWCCPPGGRVLGALAFADQSAAMMAHVDCYLAAPVREDDMAGVPLQSTWFGCAGRDR